MKRRSSGFIIPPSALSGTHIQTALPQLPASQGGRTNNPEAWDELMRELDADFT
ncbi:hypothetical protein [Paenarthrobacter sp. A20]|uniref:hypothetical protein n=1 Tax=Paenarthrobacter sp. A20 TaxID=2817891 RepID=UPI0020A0C5EF|nr:hypothetical protein [Paenarthrobacter sp. A20]MCP1415619.1 hypothetical protein [Paenarthrobacter sp. A20]